MCGPDGRSRWRWLRGGEVQHGAAVVELVHLEPEVAPYREDPPSNAAVEHRRHLVDEPLEALAALARRLVRRALHKAVDPVHQVLAGGGREALVGDHDPGGVPGRRVERRPVGERADEARYERVEPAGVPGGDGVVAGSPDLHLPVVRAGEEVPERVADGAAVVEDGHVLDAHAPAERDLRREVEAGGRALGAVGGVPAAEPQTPHHVGAWAHDGGGEAHRE